MIRILVAEDFDLIREDLCDTLEQQEDMTVVGSAATGEAILALALERLGLAEFAALADRLFAALPAGRDGAL